MNEWNFFLTIRRRFNLHTTYCHIRIRVIKHGHGSLHGCLKFFRDIGCSFKDPQRMGRWMNFEYNVNQILFNRICSNHKKENRKKGKTGKKKKMSANSFVTQQPTQPTNPYWSAHRLLWRVPRWNNPGWRVPPHNTPLQQCHGHKPYTLQYELGNKLF